MPCGGPNLGKTARVISAVLRDILRSLCNVLIPPAEPKGAMVRRPHRCSWISFPDRPQTQPSRYCDSSTTRT